MANNLRLLTGKGEKDNQFQEQIIKLLEEALEEAKAGETKSIIIVSNYGERANTVWSGCFNTLETLGAVTRLQYELQKRIDEASRR